MPYVISSGSHAPEVYPDAEEGDVDAEEVQQLVDDADPDHLVQVAAEIWPERIDIDNGIFNSSANFSHLTWRACRELSSAEEG